MKLCWSFSISVGRHTHQWLGYINQTKIKRAKLNETEKCCLNYNKQFDSEFYDIRKWRENIFSARNSLKRWSNYMWQHICRGQVLVDCTGCRQTNMATYVRTLPFSSALYYLSLLSNCHIIWNFIKNRKFTTEAAICSRLQNSSQMNTYPSEPFVMVFSHICTSFTVT